MGLIELDVNDIQQAYDGWYYTILGAGGDLDEWMEGLDEILDKEEGIGKVKQWYHTTGKVLNDKWNLREDYRFKDDLSILMFDYTGMNVGKLAIFKLRAGDRWFTDIIDNSVRVSYPDEDESEVNE